MPAYVVHGIEIREDLIDRILENLYDVVVDHDHDEAEPERYHLLENGYPDLDYQFFWILLRESPERYFLTLSTTEVADDEVVVLEPLDKDQVERFEGSVSITLMELGITDKDIALKTYVISER